MTAIWRTAVLSDRGKRRLRRTLLAIAVLALVFLLVHTGLSLIAGRRLRAEVDAVRESWGPLTLASLEPEAVPRRENRARWVRAAAGITDLEAGEDKRTLADWASYEGGDPGEEEGRTVRAILDRNREALALLQAASGLSRSDWEIDYEAGIAAEVPPLLDVINLSRLNQAAAMEALRAGRPDEAAAAVERGLALAGSLANEPVLVVQMVRLTCTRDAIGILRTVLSRGEIDEPNLARIQAALADASGPDPVRMGLLGEMTAFYALFNDMERGAVDSDTTSFLGTTVAPWVMKPMLREDMRFYLDHLDRLLTASTVPPYRRDAEGHDVDAEPDFAFYNIMAKIMLPNIADVVHRADLDDARLLLASTAVALRRHRLRAGRYPETLAEVAPDFLDTPPVDPFTGEPPRYRREGDGFVLGSRVPESATQSLPRVDHVMSWGVPR